MSDFLEVDRKFLYFSVLGGAKTSVTCKRSLFSLGCSNCSELLSQYQKNAFPITRLSLSLYMSVILPFFTIEFNFLSYFVSAAPNLIFNFGPFGISDNAQLFSKVGSCSKLQLNYPRLLLSSPSDGRREGGRGTLQQQQQQQSLRGNTTPTLRQPPSLQSDCGAWR